MNIKPTLRLSTLAAAVAGAMMLSGCATHSDKLGFAENEGTKTYAQAYEPARQMLQLGQWDVMRAKLAENSSREVKDKTQAEDGEVRETVRTETLSNDEEMERLIKEQSELAIVERGLLTLNVGDFERALFYFNAAEEKLGLTETDDSISSAASKYGKAGLSVLLGSEEMANYELRGYEKVMLLNYKALCYMLMGDRKAYNVTRRAIDLQQEEWEKFKQLLAENEAKQDKMNASNSRNVSTKDVDDRTEDVKRKAGLVTSAYVNPFGDYLNAMMMEFDGFDDPEIRQNAKIAYKKVVENNSDCGAAKNALNTVERGLPRNQKMVQILLSDGFAPYQVEQTKVFPIKVDNRVINAVVNYSNATPVATNTVGASVKAAGKTTKLSSLTRMESLILRDEQDRLPMRATMYALALLRSATTGALLGNLGSSLAGSMQHPDTRSWLTLPNQVFVARIAVPKNQKTIQLQTFDLEGKPLASKEVKLANNGPTVVYAVSYDQNIQAYANAFSWVD